MLPISCRALAEPPIWFPLKTKGGLGQSVQAPWDVGNCDAEGGWAQVCVFKEPTAVSVPLVHAASLGEDQKMMVL